MPHALAVVLLPGGADPRPTLESVRREVDADTPIVRLVGALGAEAGVDGTSELPAAEVLAAADMLAFARAGDRWRPGAFEHRLRPLASHSTAVFGVAGHIIVGSDREQVVEVRAPMPPFKPDELLLRPTIEPSAALVRTPALRPEQLDHIARPHGDAPVWSALVRAHGLVPSGEIAADVLLDPARHGHAPAERTAALLEAATSLPSPDAPGAATIRRELLRRLYIEPPEPGAEDLPVTVDLPAVLGAESSGELRPVIEDLQWTMERQREALAAERIRWAWGEVDPEDQIPTMTEGDLTHARFELQRLWAELQAISAENKRWQDEVALRDARLERLRAQIRAVHSS
jgi:hypothetical protein